MKLTAIILLSACLTVSANGYGQKVTLSEKNARLEKVFEEIKKQTGYEFLYNVELLRKTETVTVDLRNVDIPDALNACFKGQPLTYSIIDKTIVVKAMTAIAQETALLALSIDVKGRVVNENGEAIIATVTVKGTNNAVTTDANGYFVIKGVDEDAMLVITSVTIEQPLEIKINGRADLASITVKTKVISEDEVTVNTGYQTLKANEATGSFAKIDNRLLNRSVGSNILSRLEGISSGVLFAKGPRVGNDASIVIRGRSTIFSNTDALIVVDNFPYTGNINNINPNDIESITILKDAAATSIWGAFAGNGVIVITTKKAKLDSKIRIETNSNLSVSKKPDVFALSVPRISSKEYADVERMLFNRGAYDVYLLFGPEWPQSPVVDILEKERNGLVSPAEAQRQIDAITDHDVRDDINKYFNRKGVSQQYALNLRGGGRKNIYMFSVGYDKILSTSVSNSDKRLTITANNSYFLFDNKLELVTGVNVVNGKLRCTNKSGQLSCLNLSNNDWKEYKKDAQKV